MRKIIIAIALVSLTKLNLSAQEIVAGVDSTSVIENDTAGILHQPTYDKIVSEKKESWFSSWWQSLINGNVDRTFEKPIDLSFAVAPVYSKEASLSFGGQVSALFRLDRTDSIMQPSDFTLIGGGSINGTYSFGISGNVHFSRDKRLSYIAEFRRQRRDFWGINFNSCDTNSVTGAKFNRIYLTADYHQRFKGNWFWGVALRIKQTSADLDNPEYLLGQKKSGFFAGAGISVLYDSRDYILNPKRGISFLYRYVYYPYRLSNAADKDVSVATLQFCGYHGLWKGAIMAYEFYGESSFSRGIVPWQLRQEICYDDRRMRGYYSGSYIDDNQMCLQAELRQTIYKRLGAVAWGGVGTLFHNLSEIRGRQILPNYGVGLRFEIKRNTNLRMDVGFGRNTSSVIFNYAEAF